MKRLFFSLLLTAPMYLWSQEVSKYEGDWIGKIKMPELTVVFHISITPQGVTTTADSPDQSVFGMKTDSTIIGKEGIRIIMNDLNAVFEGHLLNDTTLEGKLTQGIELPLTLVKKKGLPAVIINRPQEPKPPFPYKTEDISYFNKEKSLQFGATLTIPEGKGAFPAAILVSGSGPQNRDEELLGHKPFAVLADHLTRNGFIVLRYDERGIGKSTGNFAGATSLDFASDANAALDYLLTRPEVDKKKLGIIGHSEGGMVAPIVASNRKDIDFIILLAGPGIRTIELMGLQNEAIARSAGISEETLKVMYPLFRWVATRIYTSEDDSLTTLRDMYVYMENWSTSQKKQVLEELNLETGMKRKEYVDAMMSQLNTPWFKYFLGYLPRQFIQQLRCKVLALNGEKDIQVISKPNLEGIRQALERSYTKDFEVKELPGLNHLFQTCTKCSLEEYAILEETFSPIALNAIVDWLNKKVK